MPADRVSIRDFQVEWGDVDSIGIVFYPHFFEWADAASHQLFRSVGLPLDVLLRERRLSFGLVAAAAEFHSPARYADSLACRSIVSKVGTRSIEVTHRFSVGADGGAVATLRETRVCMDVSDPAKIRARDIPEDVSSPLRRFAESRPE